MEYEDITREEALSLLSKVYRLNIEEEIEVNPDLIQKYENTLLSEEYKNMLLKSLDRMNNMFLSLEVEEAIAFLKKQLELIEKIKGEKKSINCRVKQKIYML